MRTTKLLLTLTISFCSLSQKDFKSKRKSLDRANGKICVESLFPFDSSSFKHSWEYCDANFRRRKELDYLDSAGFTYINTEVRLNSYALLSLPMRKPIAIQQDSIVIFKNGNYGLSRESKKLIKGALTYRQAFGKKLIFYFNDELIQKVEIVDRKGRIRLSADFQGFQKGKIGYWPVKKYYTKSGNLKNITTYFSFERVVSGIHSIALTSITWEY